MDITATRFSGSEYIRQEHTSNIVDPYLAKCIKTMNYWDYQHYLNPSLAPIAHCFVNHEEIVKRKWEFGAIQWTTHTSGKVIEDAGALRSGLRDLISLLPKVDYWQTDR